MQGNTLEVREVSSVGTCWKQLALVAMAASLVGCFDSHYVGGAPGPRPDDGGAPLPDGGVITECATTSAPITTPISTLVIPLRPVEGAAQVGLGHDLDGTSEPTCGVHDYANGVDNAFIDVAFAIPSLSPTEPIMLQDAINESLACVIGDATCRRLQLGIRVTRGAGCAEVSLLDEDGEVFEDPGVGLLDAQGNFRVEVPSFPLTFHYRTANGPVEVPLRMRGVVITGRVVGESIVDIVIGGSLQKGEFEATVRALLTLVDEDVTFEDIEHLLASLYDMGDCNELSVGFMANWTSPP